MPLYDKSHPLAYLVFGCFLDDSPLESQWARSRASLDWYPGGPDAKGRGTGGTPRSE